MVTIPSNLASDGVIPGTGSTLYLCRVDTKNNFNFILTKDSPMQDRGPVIMNQTQ